MPFRISRSHFENLVEEVLQTLPREFTEHFKNITIIVEDSPDRELARRVHARKEDLLGLFSGVPMPNKGGFFDIPFPLPDSIFLFQRNIENISVSEKDIVEQIRKTLIHEVGHYFGFSDKTLYKYE